jgi:hypothetical protein
MPGLPFPHAIIQRNPLAHPHGALRVVAPLDGRPVALLRRVRMHHRRQRAAPHGQPGHKGAELRRRVQVDLELGHGKRALGLAVEAVDAQLGDFAGSPVSGR